jgi:hypothetical protein
MKAVKSMGAVKTMKTKLSRLAAVLAASVLALGMGSNTAWSTRAYADGVTGEVTAIPISGQIEVAHQIYHIKAQSPADQAVHNFSLGQIVHLVLDGPASSPTSQVIAIMGGSGSGS